MSLFRFRGRNWLASGLLTAGIGVAGFGVGCAEAGGADGDKPATRPAYPSTVCVVSDEPLGSMGKPHVIQYEGREVRFCCAGCEKDFQKDPKKYLKKLDAAATTQPTAQHDHKH